MPDSSESSSTGVCVELLQEAEFGNKTLGKSRNSKLVEVIYYI